MGWGLGGVVGLGVETSTLRIVIAEKLEAKLGRRVGF